MGEKVRITYMKKAALSVVPDRPATNHNNANTNEDFSATLLSIPSIIERRRKALTAADLAELLPIKAGTFQQWAREGRMPAMKVNGCLVFDPKLTGAWLRERMNDGRKRKAG